MNASFDFKAAGYAAPGDWARLYDLLPPDVSKKALAALESAGETKPALLALLAECGVEADPAYDANAASTRNIA